MSFKVLFEDDYFLAAEKPAGLPSQATVDKRRPDFFNLLKKQLQAQYGADFYLGLHHRLDRDTSGTMIFTKNKSANENLALLFKHHLIQKTYLCWTGYKQTPDQWEVTDHLTEIRDPLTKKMKMHSVRSGGKKAHTLFRRLKSLPQGLLIEAQPLTGRMHQIRVHLSEAGLGIYGDDIYPSTMKPTASRLMLHAFKLNFIHPWTQAKIQIECPPPTDFQDFELRLSST